MVYFKDESSKKKICHIVKQLMTFNSLDTKIIYPKYNIYLGL
jgi:hypothetical protein